MESGLQVLVSEGELSDGLAVDLDSTAGSPRSRGEADEGCLRGRFFGRRRVGGGFAFDELGPLGIRPTAGSCWAKQGKPNQLPATYRRTHGVTYFHGCYSVGDDRLWGVNHRRKGTANSLAA
jgi:hypothetical protein